MNSLDIPVADPSAVSLARREAAALGAGLGFDDVRKGQVALVATELATNLIKHAGGGRMLLGVRNDGLDLLALDAGPGIANVAACLADGYSTAGTPGNGLGAVSRLSSEFGIASWPGIGTAVHAHVGAPGAVPGVAASSTVAVVVPKRGEVACGDAWCMHEGREHRTLMVVDGLGHGTEAAVAAREAVNQFQRQPDAAPDQAIQALHMAMRHTRGGAVAVARIQWASRTVVFAGLGNIAAAIVGADGATRRLVSLNGTAGHNARKVQAFEYPFSQGILVMHSDGLGSRWGFDRYAGLARAHPCLVAGVLYRDHARGTDDATMVVTRLERP